MTKLGRFLVLANILRVPPQAASFFSFGMGENMSKTTMPTKEQALPGREEKITVSPKHTVLGNPTMPPFPDQSQKTQSTDSCIRSNGSGGAGSMQRTVGMWMWLSTGLGCFWGAERKFWQQKGVFSTQVGYAGGLTPNPSYKEVCSGMTRHNEVVRVVFDPAKVTYADLLKVFWESHDPTQGMRQGNDVGTQYRSGIYTFGEDQQREAEASRSAYQQLLTKSGHGTITTEILPAPEFYYAEDYHQQYLDKNPGGYCGLGGTGVSCPIGLLKKSKDEL